MAKKDLLDKYYTLQAMAESKMQYLEGNTDSLDEELLPIFLELAICENKLNESGILQGMSSLERSRIMRRPSTRLKLRRAAGRFGNTSNRAQGLKKYLRKSGSASRPSAFECDNVLFDPKTYAYLTENAKYDMEDIMFVLKSRLIDPDAFYKEFNVKAPDGTSPETIVNWLYVKDNDLFNKYFKDHLMRHGVVLDPMNKPLIYDPQEPQGEVVHESDNIGSYATANDTTTQTDNIAKTPDPGGYKKDRKRRKTKMIYLSMKGIKHGLQKDTVNEDSTDIIRLFSFYEKHQDIFEEEADEVWAAIHEAISDLPVLAESYSLIHALVKLGDKFGFVHSYSDLSKAYMVSDIETGDFAEVPASQLKVVMPDAREKLLSISESIEGDIAKEFVTNVENKSINSEEDYNKYLEVTGTDEKELKENLIVYFADEDTSRVVAESVLAMISKYASPNFPLDIDIFAAEVLRNKDILHRKQVVLWVNKVIFAESKKSFKILKSLFSLKVFWSLIVGLFLFARESGILKIIFRRMFPFGVPTPSVLIPDQVKDQLGVPPQTIDKFTTYVVDKIISPTRNESYVDEATLLETIPEKDSDQDKSDKLIHMQQMNKQHKEAEKMDKLNSKDYFKSLPEVRDTSETRGRKLGAFKRSLVVQVGISEEDALRIEQYLVSYGLLKADGTVTSTDENHLPHKEITEAVEQMIEDKKRLYQKMVSLGEEDEAVVILKTAARYEHMKNEIIMRVTYTLLKSIKAHKFSEMTEEEKKHAIIQALIGGKTVDDSAAILGLDAPTYQYYQKLLFGKRFLGKQGRKTIADTNQYGSLTTQWDEIMRDTRKLTRSLEVGPLMKHVKELLISLGIIEIAGKRTPKKVETWITKGVTILAVMTGLLAIATLLGRAFTVPGQVENILIRCQQWLKQFFETFKGGDAIFKETLKNKLLNDKTRLATLSTEEKAAFLDQWGDDVDKGVQKYLENNPGQMKWAGGKVQLSPRMKTIIAWVNKMTGGGK